MEVVLQRLARPRPIPPAKAKGGAIGAQITALRAIKVAEAHDAGRHRARQGEGFTFEDCIDRRLQRLVQSDPTLDGVDKGEARVDSNGAPSVWAERIARRVPERAARVKSFQA
jgi:hypothetical protein